MVCSSLQHVKLSKKGTLSCTVQYIYNAIQENKIPPYLCKGNCLHENPLKTTFNYLKVVRIIDFQPHLSDISDLPDVRPGWDEPYKYYWNGHGQGHGHNHGHGTAPPQYLELLTLVWWLPYNLTTNRIDRILTYPPITDKPMCALYQARTKRGRPQGPPPLPPLPVRDSGTPLTDLIKEKNKKKINFIFYFKFFLFFFYIFSSPLSFVLYKVVWTPGTL